jgi:hypothetical protein
VKDRLPEATGVKAFHGQLYSGSPEGRVEKGEVARTTDE